MRTYNFVLSFLPFLLGLGLSNVTAGNLPSHAQMDLRFSNSSSKSTPTKTGAETSPIIPPSITPPPKIELAFDRLGSLAGQYIHCFNTSFVNSIPQWVGNQTIPPNECWEEDNFSCRTYKSATIDVGSVELYYFPTTSSNISHPSTHYDAQYNFTFTSPSVYMIWKTISAWNTCGSATQTESFMNSSNFDPVRPVGPILRSVIHAMDLTEVSSYVPYQTGIIRPAWEGPEGQVHVQVNQLLPPPNNPVVSIRPVPVQLALSDLYSNCPPPNSLNPAQWTAMVSSDPRYYRCNPYLVIPRVVLDFGTPWWKNCEIKNEAKGMPDPPYAIGFEPNSNLLPLSPEAPKKKSSTGSAVPGAVATPPPAPTQSTSTGGGQIHDQNVQKPSPGNIDHHPSGGDASGRGNGDNRPSEGNAGGSNGGSLPGSSPSPGNNEHHPSLNGQTKSPNEESDYDGGSNHNGATQKENKLNIAEGSDQNEGGKQNNDITNSPSNSNLLVSAVSVAVIGTDVISAVPGNHGNSRLVGYVVPGGLTLRAGSITTLRANDGKFAVASVDSGGTLFLSTVGAASGSTISVPKQIGTWSVGFVGLSLPPGKATTILAHNGKSIVASADTGGLIISTVGAAAGSTLSNSRSDAYADGVPFGTLVNNIMNGGGLTQPGSKTTVLIRSSYSVSSGGKGSNKNEGSTAANTANSTIQFTGSSGRLKFGRLFGIGVIVASLVFS